MVEPIFFNVIPKTKYAIDILSIQTGRISSFTTQKLQLTCKLDTGSGESLPLLGETVGDGELLLDQLGELLVILHQLIQL